MVAEPLQLPLLREIAPGPIRTGQRHYIPVLLDKKGERDALREASAITWARMTPMIQLELRPRMGVDPRPEGLRQAAIRLRDCVQDRPVYVDVLPASARRLGAPGRALAVVHEQMRRAGLRFIPVYTAGAQDQAPVMLHSLLRDQRGLCVRYKALEPVPGGANPALFLAGELERVESRPEDTDLVVDLGWLDPNLVISGADVEAIVTEARAAGPWRAIAVAATSIPRSLGQVAEGSLGVIERADWRLWREIEGRLDVVYADYGVQHPRAPYTGSGGRLRANVRYTTSGGTVVARGAGVLLNLPRAERERQYRELCVWIIERPEFAGSQCCWGDRVIQDAAAGAIVPGAQDMWRGAGTSHHLATVTRALEELDLEAFAPARPAAVPRARRARRRTVERVAGPAG